MVHNKRYSSSNVKQETPQYRAGTVLRVQCSLQFWSALRESERTVAGWLATSKLDMSRQAVAPITLESEAVTTSESVPGTQAEVTHESMPPQPVVAPRHVDVPLEATVTPQTKA
jgi:hypothetical protein